MNFFEKNSTYLLQARNLRASDFFANGIASPAPEELVHFADTVSMPLDELFRTDLEARALARSRDIRLLCMDMDGVLTDAGMYYTEQGDELKKFNAKDGLAIRDIRRKGIHTGIITHGFNTNLITKRAERLQIDFLEVSQVPKLETLSNWCSNIGISLSQVCYIGDDRNDLEVLRAVGFSACPADAVNEVKTIVNVIISRNGGDACVRELIDLYLA